MASILGFVRRNWLIMKPPATPKHEAALKFGILGAANIAPMALIVPATSHPDVIVYAVAARDKAKATGYAKKHGIPEVRDSYDAILDDPDIDAVYIPLPNGLHYEWTLKALAKGKHVLLEKPSTSNATEAETLFHLPLLQQPNAPVLMEAFHNRFSPAWPCFLSTIDQANIDHVHAKASVSSFILSNDDIRFNYDLAGGATMDLGTYPIAALRATFGTEPEACLEANLEKLPAPLDRCDGNFKAKFQFPNGAIGEIDGGLKGSNISFSIPTVTVTHRPVIVTDENVEEGTEMKKTRKVTFVNFMLSQSYHRIDIVDEFVVTKKDTSQVVRNLVKRETKKAYTFREMGLDQPSEIYWQTYRYMLEQFVNRVRGREGTGVFVSHEDSVAQMRALDMVYRKSGLGLRPTSTYKLENS